MNKRLVVFLVLNLVFVIGVFSQKIKLRIDIGNSVNFSSYKSSLFLNSKYIQEPIETSEYTYKIMPRCSLLNIPTNFGLFLEFDYKEQNHFTFGLLFGEIASAKDRVIYNFESDSKDSLGYRMVGPFYTQSDIEYPVGKINFTYARDFGKRMVRFSPFIGVSYAWILGNPQPHEQTEYSYINLGTDNMFPSSDFYIEQFGSFDDHTSTMMALLGFNIRIHSKKREWFAIKFYYEQGLRPIFRKQTIVYRNSNKFVWNLMYSYGSALYIKLSIPINIYSFK